jgi:hypothetical protein
LVESGRQGTGAREMCALNLSLQSLRAARMFIETWQMQAEGSEGGYSVTTSKKCVVHKDVHRVTCRNVPGGGTEAATLFAVENFYC